MAGLFINSPKTRPVRSRAAQDAIELQAIAMRDCLKDETPVHVRAALMRAWVDLQEMRLRLAMKPAPKPIDVSDRAKRGRKQSAPVAPLPSPLPPAGAAAAGGTT
jgi:hypothetical protein